MKKILVSGTRLYLGSPPPVIIDAALKEAVGSDYQGAFVIHGDCPTGVDAYVTNWCERHGVHYARCRALWSRLGKSAGPLRNGAMIRAFEPNVVLAFPAKTGSGTQDCITQAVGMGIDTKVFVLELEEQE